ncbi:MAG: hypothetical protein VYB05_13215 [Pseudomonadota bacterium]|nr:hypothetical protein [Pseudomonadota bacterium]
MRSGDFLRMNDGRLWMVGGRFRVSRGYARQYGIPPGKQVFIAHAHTLENGAERLTADFLPVDEAFPLRIGIVEARHMGLPVHEDVEGVYNVNGAPLHLHDLDHWRFAGLTNAQGQTSIVWWWRVMLAFHRNRMLGPIASLDVPAGGAHR